MDYRGYTLEVKYKRIKRLNARIRDAKILVSAPYYASMADIIKFLDENYKKIEKVINEQLKVVDKNVVYIFGTKYNLTTIKSTENKVNIVDDTCYCFYKNDYAESLDLYYKKIVKDELELIVNKYEDVMNEYDIKFKKITIKKMKSRWGSCLASKRFITINSNLGKYPKMCLEYVFCHEIAHIKYQNHSARFYDFIYLYFKDEKLARKNLKKYF